MILDAATLLDYFDANSGRYWGLAGRLELAAEYEELVVSPFVIAELEGLVRAKFGLNGWLAVLDELAGGAWSIAGVDEQHLASVRELAADGAGLAAASVEVLTEGPSPG